MSEAIGKRESFYSMPFKSPYVLPNILHLRSTTLGEAGVMLVLVLATLLAFEA